MIDWERELNVSHVTETIDGLQAACDTCVVFFDWSHGRVIETAQDRLIEIIIDLRLSDTLHTQLKNLFRLKKRRQYQATYVYVSLRCPQYDVAVVVGRLM